MRNANKSNRRQISVLNICWIRFNCLINLWKHQNKIYKGKRLMSWWRNFCLRKGTKFLNWHFGCKIFLGELIRVRVFFFLILRNSFGKRSKFIFLSRKIKIQAELIITFFQVYFMNFVIINLKILIHHQTKGFFVLTSINILGSQNVLSVVNYISVYWVLFSDWSIYFSCVFFCDLNKYIVPNKRMMEIF